MAVAAHVQPTVAEAVGTREEGRVALHDAFLQEGESLRRLESGARRIDTHDGPVEQRLAPVSLQQAVVLASLAAYHVVGIEGGRRHHAQYLARGRLNGHNGSNLALHQAFAQHLQVYVKPQRQVLARHRGTVHLPVHVVSLYASVGIAQQHFHALLAAQELLVATFDALLAYVVATVVVGVGLYLALRHLADVAQGMGRSVVGVLTYGASLNVESRVFEKLFLKHAALFGRKLRHESLRGIGGVAGIEAPVAHVGHTLVKLFEADPQRTAEVERIEVVHFAGNESYVVGGLVEDEQLSVAVVDGSARGVLHFVEEGVAVGILLIFVRHYLQEEQAGNIYQDNGYGNASNDKFPFLQLIILGHLCLSWVFPFVCRLFSRRHLLLRINSMASTHNRVSTELQTTCSITCHTWANEKYSTENKAA